MPIIVKPVKIEKRFVLEIVSGYRSGQFVGSEDGIFAQFFSTEEGAIKWAEETGYTVAIDVPLAEIEDGDLNGIPLPSAEYKKLLDTKVNLPEGTQILAFGDAKSGGSSMRDLFLSMDAELSKNSPSSTFMKDYTMAKDYVLNSSITNLFPQEVQGMMKMMHGKPELSKEELYQQQIDKHSQNYPKGMTVKELKALIADWPEVNQDGEDTVVLISTESGIDCSVHSSWCSSVRYNENDELVYDLSLDVEKD